MALRSVANVILTEEEQHTIRQFRIDLRVIHTKYPDWVAQQVDNEGNEYYQLTPLGMQIVAGL